MMVRAAVLLICDLCSSASVAVVALARLHPEREWPLTS
jgi:hypothetical protein